MAESTEQNILFSFKKGVDPNEIGMVTIKLLMLFTGFVEFATRNSLPVVITSIKEHVEERVSRSHEQGRAIDVSINGWSYFDIDTVCSYINNKYEDIAAISYSDNVPRACVYHDVGMGRHIHLQVKY